MGSSTLTPARLRLAMAYVAAEVAGIIARRVGIKAAVRPASRSRWRRGAICLHLSAMPASLAALIPTRNRPDLAMNAVRSLKDQGVDIDLYVSDNSAAEGALRAFCEAEGVTYLRPPAELSMPEHWDWALRQALERSPATHFTLHYDRKFSKPGHWDRIRALADRRPDQLIAFPVDHSS